MKKATTLALTSALALGAIAGAPTANAQSSDPNPSVPGSVMSSKISTLPEDIKQDQEEYRNFIQNELNEKPTGFDNFVSGSSTFANAFLSDKALVNAIALGVVGAGLAAVIGAATSGNDVVKEVLDQAGINPRI